MQIKAFPRIFSVAGLVQYFEIEKCLEGLDNETSLIFFFECRACLLVLFGSNPDLPRSRKELPGQGIGDMAFLTRWKLHSWADHGAGTAEKC